MDFEQEIKTKKAAEKEEELNRVERKKRKCSSGAVSNTTTSVLDSKRVQLSPKSTDNSVTFHETTETIVSPIIPKLIATVPDCTLNKKIIDVFPKRPLFPELYGFVIK